MNHAVFLDRDGTLNALIYYADTKEYESPRTPEELALLPNVETALRRLSAHDYKLFLISNQPSYAKGKTSLENLQAVHMKLTYLLNQGGVQLTDAYYCYHHPNGIVPAYKTVCNCRKPGIESLLLAQQTYNITLNESWMIGDQDSDVRCGHKAGCRTILLDYAPSANKRDVTPDSRPDARCASLLEAIDWLIDLS
jgi:D-glycero-D-manno-heptose 1,7-bisphosphate phosphatase